MESRDGIATTTQARAQRQRTLPLAMASVTAEGARFVVCATLDGSGGRVIVSSEGPDGTHYSAVVVEKDVGEVSCKLVSKIAPFHRLLESTFAGKATLSKHTVTHRPGTATPGELEVKIIARPNEWDDPVSFSLVLRPGAPDPGKLAAELATVKARLKELEAEHALLKASSSSASVVPEAVRQLQGDLKVAELTNNTESIQYFENFPLRMLALEQAIAQLSSARLESLEKEQAEISARIQALEGPAELVVLKLSNASLPGGGQPVSWQASASNPAYFALEQYIHANTRVKILKAGYYRVDLRTCVTNHSCGNAPLTLLSNGEAIASCSNFNGNGYPTTCSISDVFRFDAGDGLHVAQTCNSVAGKPATDWSWTIQLLSLQ